MRLLLVFTLHIIFFSTELCAQSRDAKASVDLLRAQALKKTAINLEQNQEIQAVISSSLENDTWHTVPKSKSIATCASPDSNLLLFTWNQPLKAGKNCYYGLIAYRKKRSKPFDITLVIDTLNSEESTVRNQDLTYNENNWPGAAYYELIPFKRKGGKSYALLGWRGEDLLLSAKVIDMLTINKRKISFGLPVLKTGQQKTLSRVYLSYPADLSYPLKYKANEDLIVYEELDVRDNVNSTNDYDLTTSFNFRGFQYRKGFWLAIKNLDVRMPKREKREPQTPPNANEEQ